MGSEGLINRLQILVCCSCRCRQPFDACTARAGDMLDPINPAIVWTSGGWAYCLRIGLPQESAASWEEVTTY